MMNSTNDGSIIVYFRLKLWSYDLATLQHACEKIINIPIDSSGFLKGPIPLPKRTRSWCVLKSPHVNKKSREHFEATTYSRIVNLGMKNTYVDQFGEDLSKAEIPSGVDIVLTPL